MRGVLVAFALAACSSSSSPASSSSGGPDAGGAATITVSNFKFDPPEITVKAGNSVTWNFTGGTHNVVSGANCTADNKFTSGPPKAAPYSFTQRFDSATTVDYFCQPHCASANMVGRVIVE
jgi:plastocyanin